MNKLTLLRSLTEELRTIDGGNSIQTAHLPGPKQYTFNTDCHENCFPSYRFLYELNDFPTLCFYIVEEAFREAEAGIRYKTATFNLRGYVHEDLGEHEDSTWWAEALLDDVEHVLNNLKNRVDCLVDVRILQLSTDEGVMAPYGVADMIFTITYESEL